MSFQTFGQVLGQQGYLYLKKYPPRFTVLRDLCVFYFLPLLVPDCPFPVLHATLLLTIASLQGWSSSLQLPGNHSLPLAASAVPEQ